MKIKIGFMNGWRENVMNVLFGLYTVKSETGQHIILGLLGFALTITICET